MSAASKRIWFPDTSSLLSMALDEENEAAVCFGQMITPIAETLSMELETRLVIRERTGPVTWL